MAKPWLYRKKSSNHNNKTPIDKSYSFSLDNLPNYGFIGFRLYFYDYCNNSNSLYSQFCNLINF